MSPLPVTDPVSGWRLDPDTPPQDAWWPQALLSVAMLDEITGLPPIVAPVADTTAQGLIARASGTQAGLIGQPLQRYRPGHVAGASLNLSLSGGGYLPVTLNAALGAEPSYPGAFDPADLSPVALHRAPVTISGRTVSRSGAVRAGAAVSLDGLWLTLADLGGPPAAPNMVSLASPLCADRSAAATVAAQPMTPVAAEAKTLLAPANVGDGSLMLSDQSGLAPGAVVALDAQDPARAEYVSVTSVRALGPGTAFPASVSLAFALTRAHAAGAGAVPVALGPTGAANPLSVAARAGDVTLLPSAMAGLTAPGTAAVVSGGGPAPEYHVASPVGGVSGADGFVTLPPTHRAAQLRLRVHHPAETADLVRDVMLPLGAGALVMDLAFP